ncbi:hypothetical protein [Ciceribacter sp. L1K22]|uniref:hypothetical protein n=1 Tax=Ciceribacter sp. L1K22 TaxID=2820275 RepID=UPI001ABE27DD|nr:hypothetical protein [Ciceribacter sp. L1K22]MBO3761430.1 hypothetical protein [Ciceribacter sp. L1K22]
MAKFVVLGVSGEEGYWFVDFEAGTVTAMPSTVEAPFGYSTEARSHGAVLTAGVDLAVTVTDQDDAFAGRYDSVPFSGRYDT